jgi:hypothetical protein
MRGELHEDQAIVKKYGPRIFVADCPYCYWSSRAHTSDRRGSASVDQAQKT